MTTNASAASVPPDPEPIQLSGMFIRSCDTLNGTDLDQKIPLGWNDSPPLLQTKTSKGEKSSEEDPKLLKGVIRKGIPPALRCAVWLSNIIQTVHPHQAQSYWHEYRTLAKAKILDNAYEKLLESIICDEHLQLEESKDASFWLNSMEVPSFGRTPSILDDDNIPLAGKAALAKVLIALDRVLGFDYAPLVPRLTALLLSAMSESYGFCAVREMAHNVSYYIPCEKREYAAWCGAFGIVMKKLHESTHEYLYERGVLDEDGLKPIFQDFFVDILPFPHVLRILDIYTLEGMKSLYRFAVALLDVFKTESAVFQMIARANEFWDALKEWTHDPRFNFEYIVSKAYGTHGRGPSRRFGRGGAIKVFPRRQVLMRIVKSEYARIMEEEEGGLEETRAPVRPLGLVQPTVEDPLKEPVKPILAQPIEVRRSLAEWLPLSLRLTNMELLYSTNHHGRTLEIFYPAVKHAKHTLVLCEVLNRDSVIGMYASQAWRESNHVYGDGECFLFRLKPNAQCWKWRPRVKVDDSDFEQLSGNKMNFTLEQFMVSTRTFISMGGTRNGSSGLRLNEDFTKGESSSAAGFDNEPLYSGDSVFDIGVVEVYGLASPW